MLGSDLDSAIVFAQEPAAGLDAEEGTVVILDVRVAATCNPPDPLAPGVGEVIITVFFECDGDGQYPQ
nr:hypothetical protein [Desulfuromonadales bacterium]